MFPPAPEQGSRGEGRAGYPTLGLQAHITFPLAHYFSSAKQLPNNTGAALVLPGPYVPMVAAQSPPVLP